MKKINKKVISKLNQSRIYGGADKATDHSIRVCDDKKGGQKQKVSLATLDGEAC